MLRVTEKLIKYARKKIKINRVYADKWFYQVQFIKTLKEANIDFVIQAPLNEKVNKVLTDNKDKDTIVIEDFEIKDKYSRNKEKANFFAVKKRLFSVRANGLEEDLNKGIIPEDLRNRFKTKGFPLSEKAVITRMEGVE